MADHPTLSFDAEAADIVIIPPESLHSFINTGSSPLRHTAIHEAPAQAAIFPDGSGSL